jgi:hypothetical protein
MNEMKITSAQYAVNLSEEVIGIKVTIDDAVWHVPLDPANRHYDEIMRQVEAGTLVIAEA